MCSAQRAATDLWKLKYICKNTFNPYTPNPKPLNALILYTPNPKPLSAPTSYHHLLFRAGRLHDASAEAAHGAAETRHEGRRGRLFLGRRGGPKGARLSYHR